MELARNKLSRCRSALLTVPIRQIHGAQDTRRFVEAEPRKSQSNSRPCPPQRDKLLILATSQEAPSWTDILKYFRGSELQSYFTRMVEDKLKAVIKPQYVDQIPKHASGRVEEVLRGRAGTQVDDRLVEQLGKRGTGSGLSRSVLILKWFDDQICPTSSIETSKSCPVESSNASPSPWRRVKKLTCGYIRR